LEDASKGPCGKLVAIPDGHADFFDAADLNLGTRNLAA
jgi:hypothetical protein